MSKTSRNTLERMELLRLLLKILGIGYLKNYASQLLSGIKRSNFNCELIANDLIWLSENLPLIAEGDLKSYLYSGADIRLQLKEILPLFETMQISDPEIAEIILNDKNCYHQKMADQIQLMALISKSNK
jgi:hypothetical protein